MKNCIRTQKFTNNIQVIDGKVIFFPSDWNRLEVKIKQGVSIS